MYSLSFASIASSIKASMIIMLNALLIFFSPIAWVMFVVSLAIIADTYTAIWKCRKIRIPISSKIMRVGFVSKMMKYNGVIVLVFLADNFLLNDFTMIISPIAMISTRLVALVFLSIEILSMDESYKAVTGKSFISVARKAVKNIKSFKNEITE